jgi:hypothetical protein
MLSAKATMDMAPGAYSSWGGVVDENNSEGGVTVSVPKLAEGESCLVGRTGHLNFHGGPSVAAAAMKINTLLDEKQLLLSHPASLPC